MKQLLMVAQKRIGMDRAIFATLLNRGSSAIANLLTIACLAWFFTAEQQGYYYTFASLFSLQVFFELGFTFVLTQFSAHEFSKARAENSSLAEREHASARLHALISMSRRWFMLVAVAFWLSVTVAGLVFFTKNQAPSSSLAWQGPWLMAVAAFSCGILLLPLNAILEGCQKIKEVAYIRTWQDLVGFGCFGLALAAGAGLYAIVILHAMRVLTGLFLLKRTGLLTWLSTQRDKSNTMTASISWKKEIFPFQWRISLSWLSGYLIFSLFNPVLFAFHGAAVAGQMGMTFAVFMGITNIAMAWITTKVPTFCQLIALDKQDELKEFFLSTLKKSSLISVLLIGAGLVLVLGGPKLFPVLANKFLPAPASIWIAISCIANFFVFASAAYLRSFKQEPFLYLSVCMAFVTALSTYFLGKYYGANGMTFGYMAATVLISLPYALIILRRKLRN